MKESLGKNGKEVVSDITEKKPFNKMAIASFF